MWQNENFHKCDHFCDSGTVISVCSSLVSVHICVKYKGSMINHIQAEEAIPGEEKMAAIKKYIGHSELLEMLSVENKHPLSTIFVQVTLTFNT